MDYDATHFRRVVFIKIYEGKGLPKGKGYYCTITLGDRTWRTKTTWKDENIYGDEFTLELSNARDLISIHVYKDRSKKTDRRVGRIEFSTNFMRKNFAFDRWVPLLEMNDKVSKGELRIKLQYDEDVILPSNMYSELSELILREDMSTVKVIEKLAREKHHIGKYLAAIFAAQQQAEKLLEYLVLKEIMITDNPSTLFRRGSFATKAIEFILKTFGHNYLTTVIKPMLISMTHSDQSCEIDRAKMESGEDITKNVEQLKVYVGMAIDRIFNSLPHFPLILRKILKDIHTHTVFKFPQRGSVHYSAVGGTLFLRYIIPIFLSPWQVLCEVDDPVPSMRQLRNMTLVGTVLQKLANMQLFTHQEMPYLELNPLLEGQFEAYKAFIEAAITVPGIPENESNGGKLININFYLTDLLNFLIERKLETETLPNQEGKKLHAVVASLQGSIEKERKRQEGTDKLRSGPIGRNKAGSAAAHVQSVDRLVSWMVEGRGDDSPQPPQHERAHSRSSTSSPTPNKKHEKRNPSVVEIFEQPITKTKSTHESSKSPKDRQDKDKYKRKEKIKDKDKSKGRSDNGSPNRPNKPYNRSHSSKNLRNVIESKTKTSQDDLNARNGTKRHSSPNKHNKLFTSSNTPTDQVEHNPQSANESQTRTEGSLELRSVPARTDLSVSDELSLEESSSSSRDGSSKQLDPGKTNGNELKHAEPSVLQRKVDVTRTDSTPIRRPAVSAPTKQKLMTNQNSTPLLKMGVEKTMGSQPKPSPNAHPSDSVTMPKSVPPSPGSARALAGSSKISLVPKRDTVVRACQYCKEDIGIGTSYLEYNDLSFHPHHFLCATCGIDLKFLGFSLFRGIPVCRFCFDKLKKAEDTAKCSSCGGDLKEETESGKVWALNRWWHNKCFKCHGCSGEFVNGNYFSGPNNTPYCKTCIFLGRVNRGNSFTLSAKSTNSLNSKQSNVCVECFKPISGELYIAMGNKYHPEHFKCDHCNVILKEGNYVLANGKKMCPTH